MSSPFGTLLRASRLGYHYVAALDAYVRVEAHGRPQTSWRVEVVREAKDMTAGPHHLFVCWWEDDPTGERMVALSPALQALRPQDIPATLLLDDDGLIVRRELVVTPEGT